jgi:hypothetical protein
VLLQLDLTARQKAGEVLGLLSQRFRQAGPRFVELSQRMQGAAQTDLGLCPIGLALQARAKMRVAFLEPAQAKEQVRQLIANRSQIGTKLEGVFPVLGGGVKVLGLFQGQSAKIPGLPHGRKTLLPDRGQMQGRDQVLLFQVPLHQRFQDQETVGVPSRQTFHKGHLGGLQMAHLGRRELLFQLQSLRGVTQEAGAFKVLTRPVELTDAAEGLG